MFFDYESIPQRLSWYRNLSKFDARKDFEEKQRLKDLYEYKKRALMANGYADLVDKLQDTSPQFSHNKYDEEGLELAEIVDEIYPVSIEEEKKEILMRTHNLEYLEKTHNNFEYCRTRCKVADQRLRNFTLYPRENQMCVTDCMNVRTEKFNTLKPGNSVENKQVNFVWLA